MVDLLKSSNRRDTLPLDMLFPQIRHYDLCQKNSRYANFSDFLPPVMLFLVMWKKNSRCAYFSALFIPSYAIMNCVQKILDMLVLVIYYPQLCHLE